MKTLLRETAILAAIWGVAFAVAAAAAFLLLYEPTVPETHVDGFLPPTPSAAL